jgi:hypothetical protein
VTSPPQATIGAVDVTVTSPAGTSATSPADEFAYIVRMPVVTAISPASGRTLGGDTVTINGSGFNGTTRVTFGAVPAASLDVVTDTTISATSPRQPMAGTVDVLVTTPAGTSAVSPADQFTYVAVVPVVTGVSPATGGLAGGETVTVTGSGLTGATQVNFGTAAGTSLIVVNDAELTVANPSRNSGEVVDVTVITPTGTSTTAPADRFTYVAPLTVLTTSLPSATCGSPYQLQLEARGGLGSVTWRQTVGGLPLGLSLSPSGVISGVASPDQNEGGDCVFEARDEAGNMQSTPVMHLHLVGRRIHYSHVIDQNSSGRGDIRKAYPLPESDDPQGVIDRGTVGVSQTVDPQQADGLVEWQTQVNDTDVVVTVHTGASTPFRHSGHAILTVTFTYTTD